MSDTTSNPAPNSAASNPDFCSPAYLERRRQALLAAAAATGFQGVDFGNPTGPSGHAYAVRKSTWLTSEFRRVHREDAMDITPQDVIDVLNAAGVKSWVLMGLHGYVGYMPEPRATQDVDVMVKYSERAKAKKAIERKWPNLEARVLSQVVRFADPADLDNEGQPKVVVDVMAPWSPFQELILTEYVVVDKSTQHRLPTLEAAIVSKYAALISPHRDSQKKAYDVGDFLGLVRANFDQLRHEDLRRLADLVWEGGGNEIEEFIRAAQAGEPLRI